MEKGAENRGSLHPSGRQACLQRPAPTVGDICGMILQNLRRTGVLGFPRPGDDLSRVSAAERRRQQVAPQNKLCASLPIAARWPRNGGTHQLSGTLVRDLRRGALRDGVRPKQSLDPAHCCHEVSVAQGCADQQRIPSPGELHFVGCPVRAPVLGGLRCVPGRHRCARHPLDCWARMLGCRVFRMGSGAPSLCVDHDRLRATAGASGRTAHIRCEVDPHRKTSKFSANKVAWASC